VARESIRREIESSLKELMDRHHVPMLRDGCGWWSKGFGLADVESQRPVTSETVFNVGSISKTVAAWGVMVLVEQDSVHLDDRVEDYLTRWHLPPTHFDLELVTIRRCLSHTAGLSLHGYPGFPPGVELPTLEESLSGNTNGAGEVSVTLRPGTQWRYSGGGYTLVQLAMEEVSGMKFAELIRKEVLEPLKMKNSDYLWSELVDELAATPYDENGKPIPGPRFTEAAAAGLQTSLDDFVRFAEASLPRYRKSEDPKILAVESIEEMQRPCSPARSYGLGYSIERHGSVAVVGHGGTNFGWQARLEVVPATGDGLIVLTNASGGGSVIDALSGRWKAWLRRTYAQQPGAAPSEENSKDSDGARR